MKVAIDPLGRTVSFDENGDLVGLTLIDIRELLDEGGGELQLELPAKVRRHDVIIAGFGRVWMA